jgi:signal transduction histidine kinase
MGRTSLELGIWANPNERARLMEKLREQGSVRDLEITVRRKSGEIRYGLVCAELIDLDGEQRILGMLYDNTERKQAEEALREADRQKDEFLAILAHELRNPLAPIQNAVTVMRRLGSPDPDLQWCRDVIDHQVAHMKRLLDDLLDISRITRGKVILRRECLEVATIINQAVEVSRPVIDERGHELIITTPGHPLHVDGDLTRLAQVLSNLLNNAAKYTPEDGRIVLETKAADEKVVFRVRDNGMGISPDVLPHVFDTLVRGDRAPHREYGGLGLGLTLVRSLVELHGGNVKPTAMVRDREASS